MRRSRHVGDIGIARLYDAGVDAGNVCPTLQWSTCRASRWWHGATRAGLGNAAHIQVFLQVLDVVACAHGGA